MSKARESQPSRPSELTDASCNKRQASVFLSEVSRHHCLSATEKLLKESNRLVEQRRELRTKARQS
jgi:hypothetical protein